MMYYKNLTTETLQGEEWRFIPGYDCNYMASSLGRIKSLIGKEPKILSQAKNCLGYLQVTLYGGIKRKNEWVHRLIGLAFLDNPLNKKEINHKYGIVDDNRASELEWSTKSENELHARQVLGKRNSEKQKAWSSKLGIANGYKVIQLDMNDNAVRSFYSASEAARQLKTTTGCITRVCRGERPTHLNFKFKYSNN